jgi:hypothetical protein
VARLRHHPRSCFHPRKAATQSFCWRRVALASSCSSSASMSPFGYASLMALSREASKAQFHVALGQPESPCDIRHIPPLLQKLCERLIFFEFVHGRARDVLDQGGFHGVGVAIVCGHGARQQHLLYWHPLLFRHAACCKIASPSGDDLEGGAAGPNQQGLKDTTCADRWQDVGDI